MTKKNFNNKAIPCIADKATSRVVVKNLTPIYLIQGLVWSTNCWLIAPLSSFFENHNSRLKITFLFLNPDHFPISELAVSILQRSLQSLISHFWSSTCHSWSPDQQWPLAKWICLINSCRSRGHWNLPKVCNFQIFRQLTAQDCCLPTGFRARSFEKINNKVLF